MGFSNNLINIAIKILSSEPVLTREIADLIISEKLLLFIFLKKRNLISDDDFNQIALFIASPQKIADLLSKRPANSNYNKPALTETIVNRVIRKCFSDWFQSMDFTVLNGDFNLAGQKLSNKEINAMFWVRSLYPQSCVLETNKFYSTKLMRHILSSIQIEKKCKGPKKKKMATGLSVKRPKYLNIFFKKQNKIKILRKVSANVMFQKNFMDYRRNVLEQYDSRLPDSKCGLSQRSYFDFHLKKLVIKTMSQILNWFQKHGMKYRSIDAKLLKTVLKQVTCPATRNDQIRVFNLVERFICEHQDSKIKE